jgi:Tfp pilus assembly protein PilZ
MISRSSDSDRRGHERMDKAFQVEVSSSIFGSTICVARNISEGGIFLETYDPLPLGAQVRVHFEIPDSAGEVVAVGEVKNHYYLNYHQNGAPRSLMGMGVRFLHFEEDAGESLRRTLGGFRTLH